MIRSVPFRKGGTAIRAFFGGLTFLKGLRLLWLLVVLWFEGVRHSFVSSCDWGDRKLGIHSSSKPVHLLLVADPRVRYGPLYKPSLFGALYEQVYELSLRKAWQAAISMKPHIVIFLGDMLASGRKVKHSEDFAAYSAYFKRIFSLNNEVPMYFVPGNEDIGLNLKASDSQRAWANYVEHFGQPNNKLSVSNHTLVLLDAPGLVEEDYQRAEEHVEYPFWTPVKGGAVEFVNALQKQDDDTALQPRILFSHIPLARAETASCGPLRTKGSIHRGAGPGYQNMLGKQTTEFLLTTVKPAIVFSGDDRDYCEIRHSFTIDGTDMFVPEITLQSFSPVKELPTVGFHLLSLVPPIVDPDTALVSPSIAHAPCFLASPMRVYTSVYLPVASLTLFALLVHRYWRSGSRRYRLLPTLPLSGRQAANYRGTAASREWPETPLSGTSLFTESEAEWQDSENILKNGLTRGHRPRISLDRSWETSDSKNRTLFVWTFSFRGRRRRLALHRPSLRLPYADRIMQSIRRKTERIPWANTIIFPVIADMLRVSWPSLVLWTVLVWRTMR